MRPAFARINLNALRRNYLLARQLHGGRAMAVMKANAYGHGAVACARALAGSADGFVVAFLKEALELREAGIVSPILMLEGVFDAEELQQVMLNKLWLGVHHLEQVKMIENTAGLEGLVVWLKINSGMNRIGFHIQEVEQIWYRLMETGKVKEIVLMSHFARADEPSIAVTANQIIAFNAAIIRLPGLRSLANSAAVLGWPASHADWARAGIVMYGIDPIQKEKNGSSDQTPYCLQAVMTLGGAVVAIRDLEAGAAVGYGGRFVASKPMRVGLVAIGYADGYPRSAPDGTPVMVAGRKSRLVGRVSMDMLTVDLTDLPEAHIGSEVELWGENVSVSEVAAAVNTIPYELLCNVKRVRRYYVDNEQNE